ncbi:MAG: hypothetical protein K6D38_05075 [Pseudobutyrivibrio sp.]|nr:hypothetical protein [Pseudobutyrivibrio sp.]
MADDKLRQELLYMAKLTSKYDLTNMEVVEGILRLEGERRILDSVFGKRFKTRIFDVAAGVNKDDSCVICGKPAENHIICNHCLETIDESPYAKSKESAKTKSISETKDKIKAGLVNFIKTSKSDAKLNFKTTLSYILLGLLIIVFAIQVWILGMWLSIPDYNKQVEARVSKEKPEDIATQEQAYEQLLKDFPEEEGYTVTFARYDKEYVGRFKIDKGECCQDVEEALSDEESYDYFIDYDQVYVFYINKIDDVTGIVGMAEVNDKSQILVCGSFNDGRKTDCLYRFR